MKKKILIILGILLIAITGIYSQTGLFQLNKIDFRDQKIWEYEGGIIQGAREFVFFGDNKTCWLLIHGYSSTPKDMKPLAEEIYKEFNDTVIVPRIIGHGTKPSELDKISLTEMYTQMEQVFINTKTTCENINVVGFSMGGTIALKLAEEHNFSRLYVFSPYLILRYKWWRIIPLKNYIKLTADITLYSKKKTIAQLNDPEARKTHIAYWNMPFRPIKRSFQEIEIIKQNLYLIQESILIQQSKNDDTIDVRSSYLVNSSISSDIKEIKIFENSNHVLLSDYDKQEAINNLINFEKQFRT